MIQYYIQEEGDDLAELSQNSEEAEKLRVLSVRYWVEEDNRSDEVEEEGPVTLFGVTICTSRTYASDELELVTDAVDPVPQICEAFPEVAEALSLSKRLIERVQAVKELLEQVGCDCEEYDDDEKCLGCRVEAALKGK